MRKAFTLIELLVVISIIGILVGISVFGMDAYFQSSRDTQRKSDLKQYQTALETFANKNGGLYYISAATTNPAGTMCTSGTGLNLTGCPTDPTTGQNYNYQSNASGTSYVLWGTLENPSSPATYWVVCSNGKSATATAGIPPSGGTCPLP